MGRLTGNNLQRSRHDDGQGSLFAKFIKPSSLVPKLRAGIVGDAGWLGNVSLGKNFHPAGGQFVKAPDDA